MRHSFWFACLGMLSIAADMPPEDVVNKERAKLEGTWRVVEAHGPVVIAEKREALNPRMIFQGDRIRYVGAAARLDLEFSYKIDPAKNPKVIELTVIQSPDRHEIGTTTRNIYVLEGDTLKICGNDKALAPFGGNDGRLFILRRIESGPTKSVEVLGGVAIR